MKILRICIVLLIAIAGCGDVPNDALPVVVNKGPVTGIYLTSYDSIILGIYGIPTKGGDADGQARSRMNCIEIPFAGNSTVQIPDKFRFGHPFPNPVDEVFTIKLEIPCKIEAEIWAVFPNIQNQEVFQNNTTGQAVVPGIDQRIVWYYKDTIEPGVHLFTVGNTEEPGGFIRVYFRTDGVLAWRDVGYFNDPCLIPTGLNNINYLDRSRCG